MRAISPLFFVAVFLLIVAGSTLLAVVVIENSASTREHRARLATPAASFGWQLECVRRGDGPALRSCFTPRHREAITPELVRTIRPVYAGLRVDDLVGHVQFLESADPPEALILAPDGRPLVTLHRLDELWLSDSLWFRR